MIRKHVILKSIDHKILFFIIWDLVCETIRIISILIRSQLTFIWNRKWTSKSKRHTCVQSNVSLWYKISMRKNCILLMTSILVTIISFIFRWKKKSSELFFFYKTSCENSVYLIITKLVIFLLPWQTNSSTLPSIILNNTWFDMLYIENALI